MICFREIKKKIFFPKEKENFPASLQCYKKLFTHTKITSAAETRFQKMESAVAVKKACFNAMSRTNLIIFCVKDTYYPAYYS